MDPYKVLGISPNATDEEVKKAYRAMSKKYHPDLNPGNEAAAQKMREINAAYDLIQKGYKGGSGPSYSSYSSPGGGAYRPYGSGAGNGQYQQYTSWEDFARNFAGFGGFSGFGGGQRSARSNERTEYQAAVNFIRNGMYKEALNVLGTVPVPERDGKWYYLHAAANMYSGNRVAAVEDAKKACEIDPSNEEYRRFLSQLQSNGNFYDNYTVRYNSGIDADKICLALCCINLCTGGRCIPCFC